MGHSTFKVILFQLIPITAYTIKYERKNGHPHSNEANTLQHIILSNTEATGDKQQYVLEAASRSKWFY